MPSFFYHLAFDLTTELPSQPQSVERYWEAFRIIRTTNPRHRPPPGLRTDPDSGLPNTTRAASDQPWSNQALVSIRGGGGNQDVLLKNTDVSASTCDWRYGKIFTQEVKMAHTREGLKEEPKASNANANNSIGAGPGGLATKAQFEASSTEEEELGWGVVRLYRDGEETPGLYQEPANSKASKTTKALQREDDGDKPAFKDVDCTTLCILAVPSYLTPSDFLGFVGEKTREEVSHFRMVRTERSNRYMVLMKFRNGRKAREWRKEWNGKAFDSMEPENCHVVFVKSIAFQAPSSTPSTSFPDMTNDPFTPAPSVSPPPSSSRLTKPPAPPTPSLIELPTCPVCLERMDESTGLLTILCRHVFHCSCLQKWRGSGCPVCRYTQKGSLTPYSRPSTEIENESRLNECTTCHSDQNLWICLICGNVGCGRYDAAHAFSHYTESSHAFAMDLQTQRVWDYASDGYVHRLMQDAHDGKLVDLSSPAEPGLDYQTTEAGVADDDYDDFVPRTKLQTAGVEYTHLLTSQLDSQRMYFEGIIERAADKASLASQSADKAQLAADKAQAQLDDLQTKYEELTTQTLPDLQKEMAREKRKAEKFESTARKLEKEWREEKTVSTALMTRIEHLQGQVAALSEERDGLAEQKKELEEMVRDLMFTVSGSQKVAEMGEEAEGASVSLPERTEGAGKKKNKKGGKK